jgi:hypothetical protein
LWQSPGSRPGFGKPAGVISRKGTEVAYSIASWMAIYQY